jgi:2'-5' RNA ligase
MIRAFIAVELDPGMLQRIAAARDRFQQRISGIRWTPQDGWHLTLKFLGNIDPNQIDAIALALEHELSLFPRFSINAKGLGVFPDAKRPRVLWVGVQGEPLATLAERIENALAPLGFEREKRNFKPHLTIGRWRQFERQHGNLAEVLAESQACEFSGCTVYEVVLFQSILNPKGAEYRRLKAVRLTDATAIACSNPKEADNDGRQSRKGH